MPGGDGKEAFLAEAQRRERLRGMQTLVPAGQVSSPMWLLAHWVLRGRWPEIGPLVEAP